MNRQINRQINRKLDISRIMIFYLKLTSTVALVPARNNPSNPLSSPFPRPSFLFSTFPSSSLSSPLFPSSASSNRSSGLSPPLSSVQNNKDYSSNYFLFKIFFNLFSFFSILYFLFHSRLTIPIVLTYTHSTYQYPQYLPIPIVLTNTHSTYQYPQYLPITELYSTYIPMVELLSTY